MASDYFIETPDRTHVPDLEPRAINQMPKAGVRDLRLFRFNGTDLYAWWGKKGVNPDREGYSVFEDMLTEPFVMRALSASPAPAGDLVERVAAAGWNAVRQLELNRIAEDCGPWPPTAGQYDWQEEDSKAAREAEVVRARAVIAAMQPVGWRATKDGCELGLFYHEDVARENAPDCLIEPLFILPAPPGVGS